MISTGSSITCGSVRNVTACATGAFKTDAVACYWLQTAYIIEELDQGVSGQFSIILNYFIVRKDVDALHLIQTWCEKHVFSILEKKNFFWYIEM